MDSFNAPVPILRDYLYLDVDKVKSIAGQLEWGVPEGTSLSEKASKKRNFGWDKAISYTPETSQEHVTQRSVLDSLFPDLENALEGTWLHDISSEFHSAREDTYDSLQKQYPEGSIIRVTADNFLLDSRYFVDSIVNLSITLNGYQWFAAEILAEVFRSQSNVSEADILAAIKEARGVGDNQIPHPDLETEAGIYDFAPNYGYTSDLLRSMIRTTRGLLPEGLNLYAFSPAKENTNRITIATRLQKERRYLDADPGILASNFGLDPQPWTVVGTVGHYSNPTPLNNTPAKDPQTQLDEFTKSADATRFDRGNFIRTVSDSLSQFGRLGFLGMPQHPGLTIVPIAVYRTIAPYRHSEPTEDESL